MNMLFLFLLLMLNFGISFWNAFSSGSYLTESKLIGGWSRFLVWCGLVMSACGFTWCYLTLITLTFVSAGKLTQEQGEVLFNLGYVIIILPILGSGFGITAHSIITAYRKRNFGNIAITGWNTFAQAHNVWDATRHAPNALRNVLDFFGSKKDNSKDKGGAVIILLMILALAGGIITTALIARWADKKVALSM